MSAIAVNAASIEPREAIRETASATPKTVRAPKPTGQVIASNTPSPVAADLPPAKCNQIERLWPNITASPARQTAHGTQACKTGADGGVTNCNVQSQGRN